jgi:hypothetical protein
MLIAAPSALGATTNLTISAADTLNARTFDITVAQGSPYTVSVQVEGGSSTKKFTWFVSDDSDRKDEGTAVWHLAGTSSEPALNVAHAQANGGIDTVYRYKIHIDDSSGQELDAYCRVIVTVPLDGSPSGSSAPASAEPAPSAPASSEMRTSAPPAVALLYDRTGFDERILDAGAILALGALAGACGTRQRPRTAQRVEDKMHANDPRKSP